MSKVRGWQQVHLKRLGVVLVIMVLGVLIYTTGVDQYLSIESLKSHHGELLSFYANSPVRTMLLFFTVYVGATALSLPGATVLTLAGGAIFGVGMGTLIVSFASTIGATVAFLTARYLLNEYVQKKFGGKLESIHQGIKKDGAFYLFTLRLVPLFPFFLINLLMGLTQIRTVVFFFVSQIGMLPGTIVYVNAGTQLAQISSLKEIFSLELMLSFALVGVLPVVSKLGVSWWKSGRHQRQYKKPKTFDYNMVVIGGGSAGLVSAYIAAAVKAKVALIEKHRMGGDCLNTGCVPSKALIQSAKVLSYSRRAKEFGVLCDVAGVDFEKVMERVQKVIQEIAPHDSVERYTELGVNCIAGAATIVSPYEVRVNGATITTRNIVVATGAAPLVPDLPGLNTISYLTSDTVWGLKTLPKRLLVLGAGPIGCELAQCFARFGSQVSLVDAANRVLVREDEDVSNFVEQRFEAEGIEVLTSHRAVRIEAGQKVLVCESLGQEVLLPFDEILVALGRKANVAGFGLEELRVEISDSGFVVADEYLRTTNYSNIYVCGDVTGPYQFTHTAAHQAWFVAVNALFSPFKKFKVDYRIIPWCTFTDPEVARVGLNEQEAKFKKIEYDISKYEIEDLDRAIAEGEAHGFVKVLTAPGTDKILGVTILGKSAGDIIAEYVTAMKFGLGMNKILSTIHIYPTFAEANKFAAGMWKRQNAPTGLLEIVRKFHTWRRGR